MRELLNRPLIKQRTPEWFKLRENRLTASDLYDACKNPYSLAKRKNSGTTFNSSAIPALKWGTMFEHVATEIYKDMKQVNINEFGLIINDKIENFGASPDGITDNGLMIEIKCPIKRKIINGNIPEKYYYQIQGQLAVCELFECDYVECDFHVYNSKEEYLNDYNNHKYYGIIAEKKVYNNNNWEYVYIYSTIETINEMEKHIESGYNLLYWKLNLINVQRVNFDKNNWNNNIYPKIQDFYNIFINEKNNSTNMFIDDD